jgi:eukaryotic-like serine/threonine-protein kinase
MAESKLNEADIFNLARQIDPGDARSKYLAQACGGDCELQGRLQALLRVHDQDRDFLQNRPASLDATREERLIEGPSTQVGPYKLLEEIGEGGFGKVFMAEQQRPVRRIVALKIVKPGMDTSQVVARFEAERQALAIMDHSNIARVLDGGETASALATSSVAWRSRAALSST